MPKYEEGLNLDWKNVPRHIRNGIEGYVLDGVPVGSFLTAVITNKLKESFMQADETNTHHMWDIVDFFYNQTPGGCWGSEERMKYWMNLGGWNGMIDGYKKVRRKSFHNLFFPRIFHLWGVSP